MHDIVHSPLDINSQNWNTGSKISAFHIKIESYDKNYKRKKALDEFSHSLFYFLACLKSDSRKQICPIVHCERARV